MEYTRFPQFTGGAERGSGERVYNREIMKQDDYSSSNRRKFLIGAGSLAAGGSALFGTAATTTFNLNDRAVSANVVTDSSGAVALTDTEDPGDIINYTSDELEIDFTEGGASGVNIGSEATIGDMGTPSVDSAFTITNQTTDAVNLTFEFEAPANEGFSANSGGSTLKFALENTTNNEQTSLTVGADSSVTAAGNSDSVVYSGTAGQTAVKAGEILAVALEVNADGASSDTSEDLSGVLNITAEQP